MKSLIFYRFFFILSFLVLISFASQAQFACAPNACPPFNFSVQLQTLGGQNIFRSQVVAGNQYRIRIIDNLYTSGSRNVIVCVTEVYGFTVGAIVAPCASGNACFDMGGTRYLTITATGSSSRSMDVTLRRACSPTPYKQDSTDEQYFTIP